jgi:1-acyl-sn-glycerol-3-phosphate acyltransferase
MRSLRALAKLLRACLHLLHGMWTIWRHFPKASRLEKSAHIKLWATRFLSIVGVDLEISGTPVQSGPMLVVANHISWLDILAMLAMQPVHFVSKAEVKSWPVVGWLATNVGTLYIERSSRKDALRMVQAVAQDLQAGHIVCVFPEGTTTDGTTLLPFHANLIQAALEASSPAQAVSLDFINAASGTRSEAVVYVGDDTLLTSVWRILRAPRMTARLVYAAPQVSGGLDRRGWATALRAQIISMRE